MDTAVINIRTDPAVKIQFRKVAEELGLGVSALLNVLIRQVIRTKRVEFDARDETPSPYMIQSLKESEEDYKNGDYYSFEKPEEALAFFDKMIAESKKKN